jgi:hypothetical protein
MAGGVIARAPPVGMQEALLAAVLPYDEVVLVLEGIARQGIAAGQDGRLRTLHAQGSGDDADRRGRHELKSMSVTDADVTVVHSGTGCYGVASRQPAPGA